MHGAIIKVFHTMFKMCKKKKGSYAINNLTHNSSTSFGIYGYFTPLQTITEEWKNN
jgi:hypothetical protein